ncbi:MAG TPA: 50S ribosomal protein L31 [Candidatus Kapabacteria bacterium]|nr:50S ribosomal protein L31 [Candidatus Kapabacteria bacterium]
MKKGIHPYYHTTEVVMTDGSVFLTRSCYKNDKMVLEIDSKSHPFFTGKQVLVDTAGRVDRFNKRFQKSKEMMDSRRTK